MGGRERAAAREHLGGARGPLLYSPAHPPLCEGVGGIEKGPLGNDLLSREVALQVPSALTALTTGFGMLPGVPLSLRSPRDPYFYGKDCTFE
jgi:hypothetical protein